MPRKRRKESGVERAHGHCADLLISDFGIPQRMRKEVCGEVAKVWKQNTMIHCLIIASVRGFQPHPATRGLQYFLERHGTQKQRHRKPEHPRQGGTFDKNGFYHPAE